jgi:hypothetical protein
MNTIFFSNKSNKKRLILGDYKISLIVFIFFFLIIRTKSSEFNNYELILYLFIILIFSSTMLYMKNYIIRINYDDIGVNFKYYKWLTLTETHIPWDKLKIQIQQIAYVRGKALMIVVSYDKTKLISQRCKLFLEYSDWEQDRLEEIYKQIVNLKKEYTK